MRRHAWGIKSLTYSCIEMSHVIAMRGLMDFIDAPLYFIDVSMYHDYEAMYLIVYHLAMMCYGAFGLVGVVSCKLKGGNGSSISIFTTTWRGLQPPIHVQAEYVQQKRRARCY